MPPDRTMDTQQLLQQLAEHRIEIKNQASVLSQALAEIESLRASTRLSEEEDPVGHLTLSPSGTILKLNRAAARMIGRDPSLLLGLAFFQLVREEYRSTLTLFLQICRETVGGLADEEFRLEAATPSYVRLIAFCVKEPGEAEGCFIMQMFDITRRRLAEESFLENEKRIQDIIDNAPSLIFVKDLEGRFLLTNRVVNEIVGKSAEEMRGKTDYDVFSKEMADYYHDHDRIVLESGKAELMEEAIETPEGKRMVFLANKFPLFKVDGTAYGICGISHNITELVRSRQKFEQAAASYQALVRESMDSLALLALDGTIRCVSSTVCQALGYEEVELVGKHAESLLPEGLELATRLFLDDFRRNPEVPVRTLVRLSHKSEGAHWYDIKAKTISLGEGKAYLIRMDRPLT